MKIKIAIRDKVGADFYTREIKRVEKVSDDDTRRLAERAETVIRKTIEDKTMGGTGRLANTDAWTPEKISFGWGIGDIETLDAEVPYWNHQDKGSEGIGANWQHFLPKGRWANGRWVIDKEGGFSGIIPQSPIPALNYIASTLQQMEIEIPKILKG